MEPKDDTSTREINQALADAGLGLDGILDAAYSDFPRVFGEKLRSVRAAQQAALASPGAVRAQIEAAGLGVPPELSDYAMPPDVAAQIRSPEMLAQQLAAIGFAISAEEIKQVEAGTYPNLDVRLMLALMFLLEFSVDAVLRECLQNAMGTGKH